MLTEGIRGRRELMVEEGNTAQAYASGTLAVFATPAMIGLMEKAACESVQDELGEGYTTVGTRLEVSHLSATPIGMKVWSESELIKVEGRLLRFAVTAYDECGKIGEGIHERFIVGAERFQAKTEAKRP